MVVAENMHHSSDDSDLIDAEDMFGVLMLKTCSIIVWMSSAGKSYHVFTCQSAVARLVQSMCIHICRWKVFQSGCSESGVS